MTLPHNIAAEKAVLGSVLLAPDAIGRIVGLIEPADFFHPLHGRLFGSIMEMYTDTGTVDHALISTRLPIEQERLLVNLVSDVPSMANLDNYIKEIQVKSSQRALVAACEQIGRQAAKDAIDPETLISEGMRALQSCFKTDIETRTLEETGNQVFSEFEYRRDHPEDSKPLGVPTGLKVLDDILTLNGLPRGLLTSIASFTSHGKSALAQGFMRNAARNGFQVLDVSLEDKAEAVTCRQISALSGIDNTQIHRRIIGDNEWNAVFGAMNEIKGWGRNIHFIDQRPSNVLALCSRARRHIQREGADLVIFDYLQLVPSGKAFQKQQEHTDHVFETIEKFSAEHKNTATVLVTQMARHDGRPRKDKMYHSGKIEHGSHTILMPWRPEKLRDQPFAVVIVGKQKDGNIGNLILGWEGKTVRFFDADPSEARQYRERLERVKE